MKINPILLEFYHQSGKIPNKYYNQLNGITLDKAYQQHRKNMSSLISNHNQQFRLTSEAKIQIAEEVETAVNDVLKSLKLS